MDPLSAAMKIAGSGLESQSTRLRIVSENIANARSTGDTPGAEPYRRKTISFAAEVDRASGASLVEIQRLGTDDSNFNIEFDPGTSTISQASWRRAISTKRGRSGMSPSIE